MLLNGFIKGIDVLREKEEEEEEGEREREINFESDQYLGL